MTSRVRACHNDCVGGVHLSKHEYSKRVLIHQHMMSHYRRLYNAKCDVDTSMPSYFKPRHKLQSQPVLAASSLPYQKQLSANDMKFLENLSNMHMWCCENGSSHCLLQCEEKNCLENTPTKSLALREDKNQIKNLKSELERKKHSVKYSISSKLRDMSVYHPPRKRMMEKSLSKPCMCYASGNHSMKEDSRSLLQKKVAGNCDLNAEKVSMVMEREQEKLQYLQFVQDITQDVLCNDMFSNDNLEEICKKHIHLNREKLEMGKMIEQVKKLQEQLGISQSTLKSEKGEKKNLLSFDVNSNDEQTGLKDNSFGNEHILRFCPFVEVHETKPSVRDANCKRNVEDEKNSILKKNYVFDKHESDIFNLLKYIGFDSKLAEEICIGMNDGGNSKSNSRQCKNTLSKPGLPDLSGPYEIGEFGGYLTQNDCLCAVGKAKKNSDIKIAKKDKAEHLLKQAYSKPSRNKHLSPTGVKVKMNSNRKIKKSNLLDEITGENSELMISSSDNSLNKSKIEATKETSEVIDVMMQEDLKETSDNEETQNNKERNSAPLSVVSSPIASDYSSMKDHEESVSEAYSVGEASDEGRESASEVEEEIPDDISQTTTSSGISQLTEQFKAVSLNTGSKLFELRQNINS